MFSKRIKLRANFKSDNKYSIKIHISVNIIALLSDALHHARASFKFNRDSIADLLIKQIVCETETIALISVHFIYIMSNPLEIYRV